METTGGSPMTFTPGPWYVKQQEDLDPSGNGYVWAVKGKPESDKHYVQNPAYANSEANARLIAAAPDLLETLKSIARSKARIVTLRKYAEAAIAKAEEVGA
jgi:hypothetical protein